MAEKLRVTVVALLPEKLTLKGMNPFLNRLTEGENQDALVTVFKTPELPNGVRRLFAKVSRIFPEGEMDERWHLKMTDEFYGVGCEEVAWRITRIQTPRSDVESTTSAFMLELFRDSLPPGIESRLIPEPPPMPFGCEAFWDWIGEEIL